MPAGRAPSTTIPRRAALAALALTATACATGYGAWGLTGGYTDTQIDETRYLVAFGGNGHTSKERVWNFWFHRCAELTLEKGYAYFDLEPADKGGRSFLQDPGAADRVAGRRARPDHPLVVPAGTRSAYIPAGYYYHTVTTWNARAVVAMYDAIPVGKVLFDAHRVVERLGAYARTDGAEAPPDRKVVLRSALVKLGASGAPVRLFADGARVGYVDLGRLLVNVAEGRAAVLRVQASFARKQAELDRHGVELERARKAYDAEPDPARRADLERDLGARKKSLERARGALQAELTAEQKEAVRRISDRAAPVIERARSAQHLDTVTEDAAGGLWDVDLTDDVIRLYEESYPVPAAS